MELAERTSDNASRIILNVTDIPAEVRALLNDLKHLKIREVRICNDDFPNQDNWYMAGLFTGPYRK
jgi:hypothetical protein